MSTTELSDDEGPPMYIPSEMSNEINTERQQRYAETPMPSSNYLEDSNPMLPKAGYLLLVVIILAHFWMLQTLTDDVKALQTEMLLQFTITKDIKQATWQIVQS